MPNDVKIRILVHSGDVKAFFKSLEPVGPVKEELAAFGRTDSKRVDFGRIIQRNGEPYEPDTASFPQKDTALSRKWGTKWNAYDDENTDDDASLQFHTAWSFPTPVMDALARLHANVDWTAFWSDDGSDEVWEYQFKKGRCESKMMFLRTSQRGREICAMMGVTVFEDEDEDE